MPEWDVIVGPRDGWRWVVQLETAASVFHQIFIRAVAEASYSVRMLVCRHRIGVGTRKVLRKMKFNRKSMTVGLVGLGLVAALTTGGVVAAQATTGSRTTPQPDSTTSSSGGARQFGHMAGMEFGQKSPMTAVASYLGLSRTELQGQLQAGKSLAEVAKTLGKSVSGLEDAMVAALKTNLDTNSTLTADQKAAALERMKSRIDTLVNTTHTPGELS